MSSWLKCMEYRITCNTIKSVSDKFHELKLCCVYIFVKLKHLKELITLFCIWVSILKIIQMSQILKYIIHVINLLFCWSLIEQNSDNKERQNNQQIFIWVFNGSLNAYPYWYPLTCHFQILYSLKCWQDVNLDRETWNKAQNINVSHQLLFA